MGGTQKALVRMHFNGEGRIVATIHLVRPDNVCTRQPVLAPAGSVLGGRGSDPSAHVMYGLLVVVRTIDTTTAVLSRLLVVLHGLSKVFVFFSTRVVTKFGVVVLRTFFFSP